MKSNENNSQILFIVSLIIIISLSFIKITLAVTPEIFSIEPRTVLRKTFTEVSLLGQNFEETPHVALYGSEDGSHIVGTYNHIACRNGDIFVSGNYAYVADGLSGLLMVIDITEPDTPIFVGSCTTSYHSLNIYVSGHYAYVACGDSGFQVVDVTLPYHPILVGSCDTLGQARGVYVAGTYAYVSTSGDSYGDSKLQVIDISSPYNPFIVGTCPTSDFAFNVYVSASYAYVVGDSGLQVIDVSSPDNPFTAGFCGLSGQARGVHVAGNYAYVTEGNTGLQVIDVSSPDNPLIVGTCNTCPYPYGYYPSSYAYDVHVSGNYAYVANGDSGVAVIDITSPDNPIIVGSCDILESASHVYVSGSYVYTVADDNVDNYPSSSLLIMEAFSPLLGVNFQDSSTLSAIIPAHYRRTGTYNLHVTNPDGEHAELPNALTIVDAPMASITSIDSNHGPYGTEITISGQDFGDSQTEMIDTDFGYTTIISFFGCYSYGTYGSPDDNPYGSTQKMVATIYPQCVRFWTNTSTAVKFKNLFYDTNGNFIKDPDEVFIPADQLDPVNYSVIMNTILFQDNNHNAIYDNGDGISGIYFNYASGGYQIFTLTDEPIIYSIRPNHPEPGDIITIKGLNFGDIQGNSLVHIGRRTFHSDSPKIKLWSDTKIKIKIPSYDTEWFQGQDYRNRRTWVTVNEVDSNRKKFTVLTEGASAPSS